MKFRTYVTLVKLSTSYRTQSSKKRSKTVNVLYTVLGLVTLAPLEAFLFAMFSGLYDLLRTIHQEGAVVAVAGVLAQLLAFVFGVTFVVSSMYFTRDLETFFAYPLPTWVLVSARFVALWVTELVSTTLFAGPAFLVYGLRQGTFTTWLALVVMVLLVPVIPLMIAFILVSLFMRLTNARRMRDVLRYVGGLVGLFIYICFQVLFRGQMAQSWGSAAGVQQVLTGSNGYVTKVSNWFPPSFWEIQALTAGTFAHRLVYWGLTVLTTALLTVICVGLAQNVFLSGYMGSFESTARKKAMPRERIAEGKVMSPLWALLTRDCKVFFRTPPFVMNAVSGVVVGFFVIIFPSFSHGQSGFLTNLPSGLAVLGGAGALAFIGTTAVVAGTSTSREGKQFYHLKSLPLHPKTYVFAKWWFANIYAVFAAVLLGVVEVFVLKWALSVAILSIAMGLVVCATFNAFAVLVDLNRPNLNWTNEQHAFKGARNLFIVLGEYISGALLGGIDAVAHFVLHIDWMALAGVDFVITLAALWLCLSLMQSQAGALYEALEP